MKTPFFILSIARAAALLTATTLALAACQSPKAASSGSGPAAASPHSEKSGTQLWSENCMRCHNTRSPASHSDAEWAVAMHHMRIRANLTAAEHTKILEFLQSAN